MAFTPPTFQTVGVQTVESGGVVQVPPDAVGKIEITVFVTNHAQETAIWFGRVGFRRVGTGAVESPLALQDVVKKNTVGLAGAAIALVLGGESISVQMTGVLGQTLDWLVDNDQPIGLAGPIL